MMVRRVLPVWCNDGVVWSKKKVKEIIVLIKARSFLDELNLEGVV